MADKTKDKKGGFTIDISAEAADALGVNNQEDLYCLIVGNEVILKPKNPNPEHLQKQKDKRTERTKQLMKDFEPVLKKLAKT
jgi:hypothetical protein